VLVDNAIDLHVSGSVHTFFGFGCKETRNKAFDTLVEQRRFAQEQPKTGASTVLYYWLTVFGTSIDMTNISCILVGTAGESSEKRLVGSGQDFLLECLDIGELTQVRLWIADEDDVAHGSSISSVVVQVLSQDAACATSTGWQPATDHGDAGPVAIFSPSEGSHLILEAGTPLELWREKESNAAAFHAAAAALPLLEVTEEVYENQRKPVLGSAFSSQHLVKVERPAWSDEKGRPRVKRSVQLPRGWSWLDDEWVVDMRGGSVDADGWQYAFNWPRKFSVASEYHDTPNGRFVRRRRWIRRRVRRVCDARGHGFSH
jgi:hypothetical protein